MVTVFLWCLVVGVVQGQSPIIVETTNGNVSGIAYKSDGYTMFKGIPFAAPPLGPLRWQPPQPPASWTGTLNATSFGPGCVQKCEEPKGICPTVISEDCLYLNVWTPFPVEKSLPVMVFFPGGNYRQDAASTDLYWGEYFPNQGQIVLVTVNYRLGALSFLVTDWAAGNLGIKDQRLALEWVQANIANFGGDPKQVTIFGQSAGGASVIIHMYSPFTMGRDLFQRVVCESGSLGIPFKDTTEQVQVGIQFAKNIGCDVTDQACFLNKTSDDVLAAQLATKPPIPWPNTFMKAYEWSPTIGSEEVPYQALDALKIGNFTPVPIIMGTLLEEGIQFVDLLFPTPMTKLEYETAIVAVFGLPAAQILAAYPCSGNESTDCRPVMAEIATHKVFSCATRFAARSISANAPSIADSVYVYYYDHPLSFPGWGTNFSYCNGHVCHGSELPVLYNSANSYGFSFEPDEITLADQMEQFWGTFAAGATGPISIPASNVAWPVYNSTGDYTIQLNTPTLAIQQHRLETICDMWDKIGYG